MGEMEARIAALETKNGELREELLRAMDDLAQVQRRGNLLTTAYAVQTQQMLGRYYYLGGLGNRIPDIP